MLSSVLGAAVPLLVFVACSDSSPSPSTEATASETDALIFGNPSQDPVDLRMDWQKVCAPDSPTAYPRRYVVPKLELLGPSSTCDDVAATGGTWAAKGTAHSDADGIFPPLAWCLFEWKPATSSSVRQDTEALEKAATPFNGKPWINAVCGAKTRGIVKHLADAGHPINTDTMPGCPKCAIPLGNTIIVPSTSNHPTGQTFNIRPEVGPTDSVDYTPGANEGPAIQIPINEPSLPHDLKQSTLNVGPTDVEAGAP
jgi:hypothetical protein